MANMNRILMAEDNDDLRELITDLLSAHGFDVYAAVDGEDACEAVHTTRYQLVLLDVMMPGMDGFTLCRKIRERESVNGIKLRKSRITHSVMWDFFMEKY